MAVFHSCFHCTKDLSGSACIHVVHSALYTADSMGIIALGIQLPWFPMAAECVCL